jgi:transposase InsO family protein
MAKPKTRLSPYGRWLLVERVRAQGWPPTVAAESMGVSRATVYKWLARFDSEGVAGLEDRSSRPRRSRCTDEAVAAAIVELRRSRRWGPHRIGYALGVARSTVYAVLRRAGLNRLDSIDRPTRQVVRYERQRPGELVHIDVKKLARIPDGGGWRIHGRSEAVRGRGNGYDYLHIAVDDASRVAYVEVHPHERAPAVAAHLAGTLRFFGQLGVTVERVMTDNAWSYRHGRAFQDLLADNGIAHKRIRPHRPQTNGKVERFNRTLLDEFAYDRPWTSNTQRLHALDAWVTDYNTTRHHTAHDGQPPMTALVNKLPGNNT